MRNGIEIINLEVEGAEGYLCVEYTYQPGTKGRAYANHGDPGEATEPAHVEINDIFVCSGSGYKITGIVSEKAWDEIIDKILEYKASREEGGE